MSEMEERVARAIYEAHCAGHVPPIHPHWDSDPDGRLLAWSDARAAIAAMREPTEDMLKAGEVTPISHGWSSAGELNTSPIVTWQVMIDAALAEGLKT